MSSPCSACQTIGVKTEEFQKVLLDIICDYESVPLVVRKDSSSGQFIIIVDKDSTGTEKIGYTTEGSIYNGDLNKLSSCGSKPLAFQYAVCDNTTQKILCLQFASCRVSALSYYLPDDTSTTAPENISLVSIGNCSSSGGGTFPTDLAKETTLTAVKVKLDTLSTTGLATEATLGDIKTKLNTISTAGLATETTLNDIKTQVNTLSTSGLATETTLGDIKTKLNTLSTTGLATETTLQSIETLLSNPMLYTTNVDDFSNPAFIYIGKALPGTATSASNWRISRYELSTGLTTFANGNANFSNVYDNRTSLTYS